MPASLLLYASCSLGYPVHVQEAAIWCVACSAPSIISAAEDQYSLYYPSIAAISYPSLSTAGIWVSEDFLDESVLIALRPSHAIIIAPSGMLNF